MQGNFPFQFCGRWSRAHSWFSGRLPQEGDNVTVEKGQLLLLDTNTSILNFLHVKGLQSLGLGVEVALLYMILAFKEQEEGNFWDEFQHLVDNLFLDQIEISLWKGEGVGRFKMKALSFDF